MTAHACAHRACDPAYAAACGLLCSFQETVGRSCCYVQGEDEPKGEYLLRARRERVLVMNPNYSIE